MDCSKHKKEVAGISDMKVLAENIAALHYQSLAEFLLQLSKKLYEDGAKDRIEGRTKLGYDLQVASVHISDAQRAIYEAWLISKPFMEDKTQQP